MLPEAGAGAAADAECRVFSRYIADLEPSDYVVRCYRRALPSATAAAGGDSAFDRILLEVGRLGALPLRVADGYSRCFRPRSALRCRLLLLLAILENSPPSAGRLNSARQGSFVGLCVRVAGALSLGGLSFVAGVVLLGPLHLASVLLRHGPRSGVGRS